MFDDEFIDSLPEDNWEALKKIKNQFRDWDSKIDPDTEKEFFE